MKNPKLIFVTGGVVSSLGKGIVASILGALLKSRDITVKIKKIDPYLNVDPGTLSPGEHGEVFVTKDGAETDLDLGHYERLAEVKTSKYDYITSGAIYWNMIKKERNGDFLGKTLQVIPHVTTEFKNAILKETEGYDIVICEIGGTVGDIESIPILEAARQLKCEYEQDVMFLHVALLPYLKKAKEWKTKPTQHSVRTLLSFGIQPDMLVCRMEEKAPSEWKKKLASFCNLKEQNIFCALDAPSIYHAALNYEEEQICNRVIDFFKMHEHENKTAKIDHFKNFVAKLDSDLKEIKIAVVGKYTNCSDAYKSLDESLLHASISIGCKLNCTWVDSESLKIEDLKNYQGVIVPGGFGTRGIPEMIQAIRFVKNNNIPFLGICLGMQLTIIEALSEILEDVSSSEFKECKNPVVAKMEEWVKEDSTLKVEEGMGGNMRLGEYPCTIKSNTLASKTYKKELINERHRHRYEVNNNYLKYFEQVGLIVSGECNGLVEIVERANCDFFMAAQFHPEFNSNIKEPNDIFVGFLNAVKAKSNI